MSQFFQQKKRNNAFFSTEGEGPSLQSYISEHLNRRAEPEADEPAPTGQPNFTAYAPQETPRSGYQLNNLDVKMGAGLEQFMPTPIMRLRVTKSRLIQEIHALRADLEKYESACAQSPSRAPEMTVRLKSMRERLSTLTAHEDDVTAELNRILRYGPWLGQVLLALGRLQAALSQAFGNGSVGRVMMERLAPLNLLNPGRTEHLQLTRQARELQEMLTVRMADRAAPGQEIAELIQQYEKTIRQIEQLQSIYTKRLDTRSR